MTKSLETIEAELIAAIVKAVPEIQTTELCYPCDGLGMDNGEPCGFCDGGKKKDVHVRHITLEDVLRAVEESYNSLLVDSSGAMGIIIADFVNKPDLALQKAHWLLGLPFSKQSEKTKRFLHSILVHP